MGRFNPRYILGRIVQAAVVLWAAYTITFVILEMLPADPVALIVRAQGGDVSSLSDGELNDIKREYGFDASPLARYLSMLGAALHGDFGKSYVDGRPVASLLFENLSSTLELSILAIVVSTVVAFLLAYTSTLAHGTWLHSLLAALPSIGASIPSFWVGLLLLQVFSFTLGWLPSMGMDGWQTMVLPVITMSVPTSAMLGKLLISEFDAVYGSQQVRVAKAHGLGRSFVIWHHIAKNASLPAVTIIGLMIGEVVTGAIVAETIFSRQGLGVLIQQSVTNQDIPVVQGAVVLAAGVFVVVNLIVDLIYPLLDPRITVS